jgi:hypothetical protein
VIFGIAVTRSQRVRCAPQNGWQRKAQGFTIWRMCWGFSDLSRSVRILFRTAPLNC